MSHLSCHNRDVVDCPMQCSSELIAQNRRWRRGRSELFSKRLLAVSASPTSLGETLACLGSPSRLGIGISISAGLCIAGEPPLSLSTKIPYVYCIGSSSMRLIVSASAFRNEKPTDQFLFSSQATAMQAMHVMTLISETLCSEDDE